MIILPEMDTASNTPCGPRTRVSVQSRDKSEGETQTWQNYFNFFSIKISTYIK